MIRVISNPEHSMQVVRLNMDAQGARAAYLRRNGLTAAPGPMVDDPLYS